MLLFAGEDGPANGGAVNSDLTRSLARAVVKLGTRVATLEDKVSDWLCIISRSNLSIITQLEDALREITKLREVANAFQGKNHSASM